VLKLIPKNWFSWNFTAFDGSRATVDLPLTLPLPVRLFIAWLAILPWKRESHNG
jgi:hypothetical protein